MMIIIIIVLKTFERRFWKLHLQIMNTVKDLIKMIFDTDKNWRHMKISSACCRGGCWGNLLLPAYDRLISPEGFAQFKLQPHCSLIIITL